MAARLLGRTPAQLASNLLEKIASDSLYMAVLDEEPACDLPSTLASRRLRSISGRSRRVIAVVLDQVEGEQHRLMTTTLAPQCAEVRHPVLAGDDHLAVDQEQMTLLCGEAASTIAGKRSAQSWPLRVKHRTRAPSAGAAEAADFEIAVPGIERVAQRRRWLRRTLN